MNNTAKLFNISLTKVLLLISFSFLLLTQASAEDGLYERGIELVEQKDYEKALKAFELGAKTGDLNAMTALGIMYITGVGVTQNDVKGFKYVQDAANKSHPKAQYTLGAIYYLGLGLLSTLIRRSIGLVYLQIRAIVMPSIIWLKCMKLEKVHHRTLRKPMSTILLLQGVVT